MELRPHENFNLEDVEGEIWKDVVHFENIYQVSNFGRVKTKKREMYYDRNVGRGVELKTVYPRIRKPKLNKHTGYLMVGCNGKGKSRNVTIHSMVSKAFIGEVKKGYAVNHKDGNKLNNKLENLEIITHQQNSIHAFKNGLRKDNIKVIYEGVEYYSKAEMRRVLGVTKREQNKLIENGYVELI